eukprot:355127-Chlamydomonas_euryale.AAC.1
MVPAVRRAARAAGGSALAWAPASHRSDASKKLRHHCQSGWWPSVDNAHTESASCCGDMRGRARRVDARKPCSQPGGSCGSGAGARAASPWAPPPRAIAASAHSACAVSVALKPSRLSAAACSHDRSHSVVAMRPEAGPPPVPLLPPPRVASAAAAASARATAIAMLASWRGEKLPSSCRDSIDRVAVKPGLSIQPGGVPASAPSPPSSPSLPSADPPAATIMSLMPISASAAEVSSSGPQRIVALPAPLQPWSSWAAKRASSSPTSNRAQRSRPGPERARPTRGQLPAVPRPKAASFPPPPPPPCAVHSRTTAPAIVVSACEVHCGSSGTAAHAARSSHAHGTSTPRRSSECSTFASACGPQSGSSCSHRASSAHSTAGAGRRRRREKPTRSCAMSSALKRAACAAATLSSSSMKPPGSVPASVDATPSAASEGRCRCHCCACCEKLCHAVLRQRAKSPHERCDVARRECRELLGNGARQACQKPVRRHVPQRRKRVRDRHQLARPHVAEAARRERQHATVDERRKLGGLGRAHLVARDAGQQRKQRRGVQRVELRAASGHKRAQLVPVTAAAQPTRQAPRLDGRRTGASRPAVKAPAGRHAAGARPAAQCGAGGRL